MSLLPDTYTPREAEAKWQRAWEERKIYAWDSATPREDSFVIDTPPPTVSGVLHMGHIFSYTQADFVARYQRMAGKNVFYPMGFDDNGLPTERLVEKVKKVRARDMSREEFIALCEGVAEEARREFRRLFESVALSVDWAQEYHTISERSRRISQLSFLDLYQKECAYRTLQPMLWDPVDQTAIAQAEIDDKELESTFNDIAFAVAGEAEPIIIGTTRPELIGACVAVFYHPEDTRYQHLEGKTAITPLFGVKVPLLADEQVQMEKGTGLVMCCTFGDETDVAWWRTHELPTRLILNKYGKLEGLSEIPAEGEQAEAAIAALEGLKVKAAREKILELLAEADLVVKQEAITHAVKCAERSGAPLEILPTQQWFVKVLEHKDALKEKAAECHWYPEFMKIRMDQWIDGLSWDWCISRQRYFGVPFPVWYSKRAGEEGKILLATPDQLPVNPLVDLPEGYTRDEVEAEADVMDTWATSSVSPQLSSWAITEDLAVDAGRHQQLFPADLRPQAHEIIRTWAFYTVVKAYLHENTIPWKNLMISGWCLAPDKTKMSKSKGNVITPVELIEEKGADAVRYWASTSRLGADTAFSEDVLKIGKKLVNKLWNATRFVAIHLEKLPTPPQRVAEELQNGVITEVLDRWIISKLNQAVEKATAEFERFEYSNARQAIEDFFWNDFCDNYLEIVKRRAYGAEGNDALDPPALSAIHAMYHCLEAVLRLFAPIVPHVTEELYSHLFAAQFAEKTSIHARGNWPNAADYPQDAAAEAAGRAAVSVLDAVRKAKAERNVSLKYPLTRLVIGSAENGAGEEAITAALTDLQQVTNAAEVVWQQGQPEGDARTTEDAQFFVIPDFAEAAEATQG